MNYTSKKIIANKPTFLNLDILIEPIESQEFDEDELDLNKNKNYIFMDFEREPEFDIYYREFKRR